MTFNLSIDKILKNLRKLSPVFLSVAIVSGLILFLPHDILEKMHISNIPEDWLSFVGIIFLLSAFLIGIIVCQLAISWLGKKISYIHGFYSLKRRFRSLSLKQKSIIQELLLNEEKYALLKMTDGNAIYLTEKGFIWRPAQAVMFDDYDHTAVYCKFMAHPWLLSAYNRDPKYFFKN